MERRHRIPLVPFVVVVGLAGVLMRYVGLARIASDRSESVADMGFGRGLRVHLVTAEHAIDRMFGWAIHRPPLALAAFFVWHSLQLVDENEKAQARG